MSEHRVRFVGFFEALDFLLGQFDVERGDGLIEMFHFCGTDNGGRDVGFAQHLRQSNLRSGDAACLGNFSGPFGDDKIFFAEIKLIRKRIGL